jgi:hypothetical protein
VYILHNEVINLNDELNIVKMICDDDEIEMIYYNANSIPMNLKKKEMIIF